MSDIPNLSNTVRHHPQLALVVNENCTVPLPEEALRQLFQPHRLSFYYLVFLVEGTATFAADLQDVTLTDGQLVFGRPHQVFVNPPIDPAQQHYHLSFDEPTLALLPQAYAFLLNPSSTPVITFDAAAQTRVKSLFANLFQLLHAGPPARAELVLAHLHALLTELDSAHADNYPRPTADNPRRARYVAFQLAVEQQLIEQPDVQQLAAQLALTPGALYGLVKEFAGVSPKEWMTNRLMLEAQRRLRYAPVPVKELAYELGFSDPHYFSRLFKKSTGRSVREYRAGPPDLSSQ